MRKFIAVLVTAFFIVTLGGIAQSDASTVTQPNDTQNGFTVTTSGVSAQGKVHLGSCFDITYQNNKYAYVGRTDFLVGSDGTAHNYPWPLVNAPDQATVTLCPQSTGDWVETLTGVNPIVPGSGDHGDTGQYNLYVKVVN